MLDFGKKKPARRGVRAALLAGATVAALGLGGLGAGSAGAAPLCTGINITGQGSSLQKVAQQNVWIPGYAAACPSGPTVTYNSTGSGGGLKEWNHDGARGSINTALSFIGTDDAPTAAQITNITSVAGTAKLLTIPVAQTSIAVVAHPPSGCVITRITNKQLERVFDGRLRNWSELETAEGSCSSSISRVVRKDGSGTTYQFKNYLARMFGSNLPCTSETWLQSRPITNGTTGAPNTSWPESCEGTTLSAVVRPSGTGGGEVVKSVNTTVGGIGYAATPDAEGNKTVGTVLLAVQNNGQAKASEATFASPTTGAEANCLNAQYGVPLGARQKSGEPGTNIDWSGVFGAQPAIGGESYPLCTLTYVLAFNGYKAAGFKFAQEQTVHDYVREYIVRAAGQSAMESHFYAPLPTATLSTHNVLGAALYAAGMIRY